MQADVEAPPLDPPPPPNDPVSPVSIDDPYSPFTPSMLVPRHSPPSLYAQFIQRRIHHYYPERVFCNTAQRTACDIMVVVHCAVAAAVVVLTHGSLLVMDKSPDWVNCSYVGGTLALVYLVRLLLRVPNPWNRLELMPTGKTTDNIVRALWLHMSALALAVWSVVRFFWVLYHIDWMVAEEAPESVQNWCFIAVFVVETAYFIFSVMAGWCASDGYCFYAMLCEVDQQMSESANCLLFEAHTHKKRQLALRMQPPRRELTSFASHQFNADLEGVVRPDSVLLCIGPLLEVLYMSPAKVPLVPIKTSDTIEPLPVEIVVQRPFGCMETINVDVRLVLQANNLVRMYIVTYVTGKWVHEVYVVLKKDLKWHYSHKDFDVK